MDFRESRCSKRSTITASLGLHTMETGAGMKSLSKEPPQVKFNEDRPSVSATAVKKKLVDSGLM